MKKKKIQNSSIILLVGGFIGLNLFGSGGEAQTNSVETKPASASVTFLNVLPEEKAVALIWGGKQIFRDGLPSGKFRGPFKMIAQGTVIDAAAEGYLPARANVQLLPDHKSTFVIWAGEALKEGPNAGKRKLEILALVPFSKKESGQKIAWKIVLAGSVESARVLGNGKPIDLLRGKEVIVGEGQGVFEIKQGDRVLASVSADQPADHVFVVYGDDQQNLNCVLVYR